MYILRRNQIKGSIIIASSSGFGRILCTKFILPNLMQYQNNVQFTNSKESILSYLSIPNKKNLENKKITDGSKNSWN